MLPRGAGHRVRQYLRAGLVDELHVAIVSVLLGAGELRFDDLGHSADGYECEELVASHAVAHVRLIRR